MDENSFSLTKNINRANCLLLSTGYCNWLHENGHNCYDRDQLYNSERAYSLKALVQMNANKEHNNANHECSKVLINYQRF